MPARAIFKPVRVALFCLIMPEATSPKTIPNRELKNVKFKHRIIKKE